MRGVAFRMVGMRPMVFLHLVGGFWAVSLGSCNRPSGSDLPDSSKASCFPCKPYSEIWLCKWADGPCYRLSPAHKADVAVALSLGCGGDCGDTLECFKPAYRLIFRQVTEEVAHMTLSPECRTVRSSGSYTQPMMGAKSWDRLETMAEEVWLRVGDYKAP
jgi:hypothetical protein